MAGAVHRLNAISLAPAFGSGIDRRMLGFWIRRQKHVLTEILPMARRMPQLITINLWRDHFVEVIAPIEPSHVLDQRIKDHDSLWQVERLARRNRVEQK